MKGAGNRSMNDFRRMLGESRGSEIAEMAMVMPVMFLVFLGIFWVGRSYNIYATVNQAAREGARVGAQSTCATCGNTATADAAVVTAISTSLAADHLDISHVLAPTPAPTPTGCPGGLAATTSSNVSIWRNALLTPAGVTPQECGVIVAFTYPIDLTPIPLMSILGNVQIQARAQTRVEE
jgi:Flp pilus assembly protein TadG